MRIVYGVPWIESEGGWGQRPEGFALFSDLEVCKTETKKASVDGPYDGGYIGPVRPLTCMEIPFDSLEKELQEKLEKNGKAHTSDYWQPKFRGETHSINW